MIGCGKYQGAYLYEVTEQDLLLERCVNTGCSAGTILIFTDKRSIDFGNELARAEGLPAAKEYLDLVACQTRQSCQSGQAHHSGQAYQSDLVSSEYEQRLDKLTSQISTQDENMRVLNEQISQRDELLRDLAESLSKQKQDNDLLHLQLENAHEQLAADEIKHHELVEDLQHVSSETHTIETAFERVMEEKYQLEQELAERITELVELDLRNNDLQRQLEEPEVSTQKKNLEGAEFQVNAKTRDYSASHDDTAPRSDPKVKADPGAQADPKAQVMTMASGKQIHVLHEFPPTPKQSPITHAGKLVFSLLRLCALVLLAVLVLGAASVFATARVNDISFGAALDLIVKSFNFATGFL